MRYIRAALAALLLCMSVSAAAAEDSGLGGLNVIAGEESVRITLSADMVGDATEKEISASVGEDGNYVGYEIHEDGSVTYVMSREKYDQMLGGLKASVDECIAMLLEGEQAVDSFVRIEYNESLTDIVIYVDGDTFTTWDSMNGLSFYIYGAYYQTFLGVPGDQIDVEVSFVDEESGEVLGATSYQDYIQ